MLDDIDLKILRALQFDARIANVDLAKQVGLSPTPCWNRVKTLEQEGVIERYVTILNHAALGYPDTVIVEVTLDRHDDTVLEKFEAALTSLPEVVEAYLTTGEYDYYIKAAVSGAEGYEHFLRQRLYKIPGIRHSRSSFMLRCLKQTYSVKVEAGQTAPRRNKKKK
ncbi:MAG: Lrp/AsnC family transcriptional regulator [Rhodospirillaceae bacterium]|nr:MAG: Lrp/AsnC family transcriptional regulator [Rhodospirillaceae bacterium]